MGKTTYIVALFLCAVAFFAGLWGGGICFLSLCGIVFLAGLYVLLCMYEGAKRIIRWLGSINWKKLKEHVCIVTESLIQIVVPIVVIVGLFYAGIFIREVTTCMWADILLNLAYVVAGVFIVALLLRPNFSIGDKLALSLNNRLRIKVRSNHLIFKLHDISVELEYKNYDRDMQDTKSYPITIVGNKLTILYGRLNGVAKSSQTFHTQDAFIWYTAREEITCRVRAVHSFSGISYVRERTFTPSDVEWGIYVKGVFRSQAEFYHDDEYTREQCKALTNFSKAVLPASIRYPVDKDVSPIYNIALSAVETLRNAKDLFPDIDGFKDVLDSLKKSIDNESANLKEKGLKQLYKENAIFVKDTRKQRDALTHEVNHFVLHITDRLERQINKS